MRRLFVFDMDGTLLPGTTACSELARVTNTLLALKDLEQHFVAGRLDTKTFASCIHELWGNLPPEIVAEAFDGCPKLDNICSVVRRVSDEGGRTCLITLSPDYFARHFSHYGFDYVFASRFPVANEKLDPRAILTPADKPRIARDVCQREGLLFEESVAFGDSMSDIDLFRLLKYTVSMNGSAEFEQHALVKYRGRDLRQAYGYLLEVIRNT